MSNNTTTLLLTLIAGITLSACAQTKSTTTKAAADSSSRPVATVVEANKQRTLPGRPETPPVTDYRFVVVWQSKETPKSFFWKGEDTWQPCQANMVSNYHPPKENSKDPFDENYKTSALNGDIPVKRNDTLELHPYSGGKYPMPAQAEDTAVSNIIFCKTGDNKWLTIPVKKITKKPDIIMP